MIRPSLVIWGLFAAGCLGVLGYSYAKRTQPTAHAPRFGAPDSPAAVTEPTAITQPSGERTESRPAPASADPVFALASDVSSQSSAVRVAAIRALATAPPKQAISVLQEVLTSAAHQADRGLALNSLREMALDHGDPDNRIRDAIRHAIQTGDAAFVRDASAALNEIESTIGWGEPLPVH